MEMGTDLSLVLKPLGSGKCEFGFREVDAK